MLSYGAFNQAASPAESAKLYVVEARKEIMLDFFDVDGSISKLTEVFKGMQRNAAKA